MRTRTLFSTPRPILALTLFAAACGKPGATLVTVTTVEPGEDCVDGGSLVVSGVDENGRRFHNAAVDLYPLRDGRIARKQTYWKQPA